MLEVKLNLINFAVCYSPPFSRHFNIMTNKPLLSIISRGALLLILTVGVMSCIVTGCVPSFKFNGASLDYSVYRTISIGNFPIRAALVYPPLQTTFENELLNYISRNTRLQTLGANANSDLSLEGEITAYNLTPQAVTEDAYASKTRLTITVRVKYTDTKKENADLDQSFTAYRDFDASQMLTDVQDQLCQEISEEIVIQIFNATLSNW